MRGTLLWKLAANSDGFCGVALADEPVAEVLVNSAAVVGDGAVPAPGSGGEIVLGGLAYLRGLDYFRRGMVRSVEFGPHGRLYGEVSGSGPKPYSVVARYESGSGGTLVPVEPHASRPVARR